MKTQLLFASLVCVQFLGCTAAFGEMMNRNPRSEPVNSPPQQAPQQQPPQQQQNPAQQASQQQNPAQQAPIQQQPPQQQNPQSEPRQSNDSDENDDRRRGRRCSASNCPGNGGRPRNQCHRFERIVTNNRGERLCVVFPGNCQRPFCLRDPCDRLHQCPRASRCITNPCQPCSAFFYDSFFNEVRC